MFDNSYISPSWWGKVVYSLRKNFPSVCATKYTVSSPSLAAKKELLISKIRNLGYLKIFISLFVLQYYFMGLKYWRVRSIGLFFNTNLNLNSESVTTFSCKLLIMFLLEKDLVHFLWVKSKQDFDFKLLNTYCLLILGLGWNISTYIK